MANLTFKLIAINPANGHVTFQITLPNGTVHTETRGDVPTDDITAFRAEMIRYARALVAGGLGSTPVVDPKLTAIVGLNETVS